jgi:hypothetical protein
VATAAVGGVDAPELEQAATAKLMAAATVVRILRTGRNAISLGRL